MNGRSSANGTGSFGSSGGRSSGTASAFARAFGPRPNSSSNNGEGKHKTVRRSQSATVTMSANGTVSAGLSGQFRDMMTIRHVKTQDGSDDESNGEPRVAKTGSKGGSRRSSPSTPPRTPTPFQGDTIARNHQTPHGQHHHSHHHHQSAGSGSGLSMRSDSGIGIGIGITSDRHSSSELPRTSSVPVSAYRSHSFTPSGSIVARHHSVDKTLDFRRGRGAPHSPSSSNDDRDVSPSRTVATTLSEISTNTSYQTFRSRAYAASANSPILSSPSSPLPSAMSPPISTSAATSPHLSSPVMSPYGSQSSATRSSYPKQSTKLSKSRTLRSQGSNSTLTSIRTTESSSNLRGNIPSDASKVLGLMKELRGRMEGVLEYCIGDSVTYTRGFCQIVEETGRLCHLRDDRSPVSVIQDLRGCQIRTGGSGSDEFRGIIELSTLGSRHDVKIRPPPQHYDHWLAAFLCWQPIKPAGPNNKMVKTQAVKLANDRKVDRRRNSDATVATKDAAIIKVGKLQVWDRSPQSSLSSSSSGGTLKSKSKLGLAGWKNVSCTLQENGDFKLFSESDVSLIQTVHLSTLTKSAIQRLDPSVLGEDYCIGVYPHHSYNFNARFSQDITPPVYLAIESPTLFEVWFVLLRAYTVPELYGPVGLTTTTNNNNNHNNNYGPTSGAPLNSPISPQTPISEVEFDFGLTGLKDAIRVPRMLSMRIVEAKFNPTKDDSNRHHHHPLHEKKDTELFCEVFMDNDVRARTMPRVKASNCIWMDQFEFNELPSQLQIIDIVVKQRTVKHKRDRGPTSSNGSLSKYSMPQGEAMGILSIDLNDLEYDAESEIWWPLFGVKNGIRTNEKIGEMMLKLRKEELVVLMMDEYKTLLDLLLDFDNGLTIQIGQTVNTDLRRLGHTLLKILQVSGKATEWLSALAKAEIEGLYKGNSIVKYNFPIPGISTDQDVQLSLDHSPVDPTSPSGNLSTVPHRADGGRRTLTDANILFRGNTLFTKAVEAHMKRFGRDYLDDTVADHIKRVAEDDLYFEVDPNKCKGGEMELTQNWRHLNDLVRKVWKSIYISAHKCPVEVRKVLHNVRGCVQQKYGDILDGNVGYSSISGILFLRFFCPAVLNPKLFGILKDHPGGNAQRTLTLLAKSLQGLANMTKFGVKEPWFEPMNAFLQNHRNEFKQFIDAVSEAPPAPTQPHSNVPPSYATPITILARLPQASKEGFPSLPFLIDQPRAIGRLVQMWLGWYGQKEAAMGSVDLPADLLRFHELCLHLKDRMASCVEQAENAERPSSAMSNRWETIADNVSVASSPVGFESRESIGIGYSTSSPYHMDSISSTGLPAHGGSSKGYHTGYTHTYRRTASGKYGWTQEEDETPGGSKKKNHDEYAGVAAIGKHKLSEFVGGFKKKVVAKKGSALQEDVRE